MFLAHKKNLQKTNKKKAGNNDSLMDIWVEDLVLYS